MIMDIRIKEYGKIDRYTIILCKEDSKYYICSMNDRDSNVVKLATVRSIKMADKWWGKNKSEDYGELLVRALGY